MKDRQEAGRRRSWASLLLATPGWLASFLLHLMLLLVAALLTFQADDGVFKQFLIVDSSDVMEEEFDEVVVEIQTAMEEVEIHAIPAPDVDPGAVDFGDIDGTEAPTADVSVGIDTTDSQMLEIGALFGTGGDGMAQTGGGLSGTFFNVKATGSRFVFVVDSSMSMRAGKFEVACQELYDSVSRLSQQQMFYVIFFDGNACRMFDPEHPEPRMVRATPDNIQRLQSWMSSVELEFRTNPFEAMDFAMSLMPDAIYVLSDGEFTDRGTTVNWLKRVNLVEDEIDGTKPIVTIHTIGFYSEDNGTLKNMADTYGGTYRFVPPPPNAGNLRRPGAAGPRRPGP